MRVYLYGHYDSRGGTMALQAPTRRVADDYYDGQFGIERRPNGTSTWPSLPGEPVKTADPSQLPSALDFLTEAELRFDDPTTGGFGADLEDVGEVWQSTTDPQTLWFVPAEPFDGPPARRCCGFTATSDWVGGDDTVVLEPAEGGGFHVYRSLPVSMVRTSHGDFPSEDDARLPGWVHPRWDDDAYGFVLGSTEPPARGGGPPPDESDNGAEV